MAINDSPSGEPRLAAIDKKTYQKPGFRYEQVFVTSALSCSKTADQMICITNPPIKVS
jgi:hypothetical protein